LGNPGLFLNSGELGQKDLTEKRNSSSREKRYNLNKVINPEPRIITLLQQS
jgi:hypothetical protein